MNSRNVFDTGTARLLELLGLDARSAEALGHEELQGEVDDGFGHGVPLAVVIGVPLYSNAAGVLPLVEALHDKGLPMGTVLAFMMSVVALSLPEVILLRRVLQPRLIATYIAVVAGGIVIGAAASENCRVLISECHAAPVNSQPFGP